MQLTAQQLQQFAEEGYLFLPDCFSEEEVAILRDEAEQIYASNRQEVWREKTGAPRTAFAAQTYNEAFRLLGHHPRLIRPVEQVFGEKLYMHQFKINAKAAFEGDVWQWHQDYGTWARVCCPPAMTRRRPLTRCGRSITKPSRGSSRRAGLSRRPASRVRC
jgi:ectoine hydroxylase